MEFKQPITTKVQIVQKHSINHDCYVYKLKFVGQPFQLQIGQHFRIVQNIKTIQHPQGQEVSRKYTPISPCSQKDTMDVLFKIYRPNAHPFFPNGGKLTPWIESLKVGDAITVQGPFGRFRYESNGLVTIDGQKFPVKRIFFIAGGSGITPCYQTIVQIAKMKNQNVELILLFANKQEQDIVLRKQLEQLCPRLKLFYILDKGNQDWKGFTGYVTKQILEKISPLNDPETLYCHCGPKLMNQLVRKIILETYPQARVFKY